MKLLRFLPPIFLVFLCVRLPATPPAPEAPAETVTLRLVRAFDEAWDRGDVVAMYAMLDPECVFQSPFQRRIGRVDIRDHVFRNVKKFRDSHSTEELSRVDGDVAYAFGTLNCNHYDRDGMMTARIKANHLFIFTRRPGQDWKIRFMIALTETEEKVPAKK